MKDKLSVQKTIYFTKTMSQMIQSEADKLKVSFADIVRDCVEHGERGLKDRNRVRIARMKKVSNIDDD